MSSFESSSNLKLSQEAMGIEGASLQTLLRNMNFEIDIDTTFDSEARKTLDKLASIYTALNPLSANGASNINISLAELENKKLLKSQQAMQLEADIKSTKESFIDVSKLHDEIKEFVVKLDAAKTKTQEKSIPLVNSSDAVDLDKRLAKLDLKSYSSQVMKQEFDEYSNLKSQNAKYDQVLASIPIKQDIPLDKASLSSLLRKRKQYLQDLLQEVIESSN